MKEIAGQDRDFQHADERAVLQDAFAYSEERLRAEARLVDLAVVGLGIRTLVGADEIAVGKALSRGGLHPRGDQRPTIGFVDPDRLDERNLGVELLQQLMKMLLVAADVVGGHVGDEVLDAVQRKPDELEGALRFLLLDVERARQPFIGQRCKIAMAVPGSKGKKQRRSEEGSGHRQPHQPNRERSGLHSLPFPRVRRLICSLAKRQMLRQKVEIY